jgi:polysaccharide biosynthesis/export protein
MFNHLKTCISFFIQLCLVFLIGTKITSCSSSSKINYNPVYFRSGSDTVSVNQRERFIHPFDVLTIQVYSKTPNQEQAAIFNIFSSGMPSTRESATVGLTSATGASNASTPAGGILQGYRVNEAGNIEMPVIGTISTTGFTIYQLQDYISQKVSNYVKSPGVIVHYQQFDVNVLGEVKFPGIKKFTTDKVTILDALGASGDLTDFAKRNDIIVIRQESGKQVFYKVDLRDRSIFKSPVYFLEPNDVVYVNPSITKLDTLDIDPKSQKNTTLAFGILGVALSITTLIITLTQNHN